MPLLLNLRLVDGLKLKAGIQPTFRIGYSAKYRYEWFYTDAALGKYVFSLLDADKTMLYEGEEKLTDDCPFHSFDLVLPVGLSYEWCNVQIDAHYHFGLSDIAKGGGNNARSRCLMVTLGYNFHL